MDFLPFEETEETKEKNNIDFLPFEEIAEIDQDKSMGHVMSRPVVHSEAKDNLANTLSDIYNRSSHQFVSSWMNVSPERLTDLIQKEMPSTGYSGLDKAVDVTSKTGSSLLDYAIASQLAGGLGVAAGKLAPALAGKAATIPGQAGLKWAGTLTAKNAIEQMKGEDKGLKDYAQSALAGYVGGNVGSLAAQGLRNIPGISKAVYPFVESIGAGAATGAGFTAVDKAFNPSEVGIDELANNMAVMAAFRTIPMLKAENRQAVNQLRDQLMATKADKGKALEEALKELGLGKGATEKDIQYAVKSKKSEFTKGAKKGLTETEKLAQLSDLVRARDKALAEINNSSLASKAKNALKGNINRLYYNLRARFGSTENGLVPTGQTNVQPQPSGVTPPQPTVTPDVIPFDGESGVPQEQIKTPVEPVEEVKTSVPEGNIVIEEKLEGIGTVDKSLAEPIKKLNNMGFQTIQSHSGIIKDHPGRENIDIHGGYIAINIPKDNLKQRQQVKEAAQKTGLTIEEGSAFFEPGLTVSIPETMSGDSHKEIIDVANEMFKKATGKDMMEALAEDTKKAVKLREFFINKLKEQKGGDFWNQTTDEQRQEMWNKFADELEKMQTPEVKETKPTENYIPMEERTTENVGSRKVNAYQYDNPEVRPYYQEMATWLKSELRDSVKGERTPITDPKTGQITDEWTGTKKYVSDSIARIQEVTNASYKDIENALNRIIEDKGKENTALAKRIEMVIDENLTEGYRTYEGLEVPPNDEYSNLKSSLENVSVPVGAADIGGYNTEDGTIKPEGDIEIPEHDIYDNANEVALGMPEMVELAHDLNEGKYPQIKEKLRGQAIGRFTTKGKKGDIKLQADIFIGKPVEATIVRPDKLQGVLDELNEKYKDDENIIIKQRYNKSKRSYEVTAYKKDPTYANKVIMHEIGHMVDWLPDKTLKRGNLIGRLASLKKSYRKQAFQNMKDKEIREELKNLSMKWKPYNRNNEKFRKYRESAPELYADAISVLGNTPDMLKAEAPKFYENFMEYINRKPEVKAKYEDIQNRLKFRSELMGEEYLNGMLEMFDKDVEKRNKLRINQDTDKGMSKIVDEIVEKMFEKDYMINRMAKKNIRTGEEGRLERGLKARSLLEESRYIGAEIQNYLIDIYNQIENSFDEEKNIDRKYLGAFLLGDRVINERNLMANPKGYDPNAIRQAFESMEQRLGEDGMAKIKNIAENYRKLREEIIIPRLEQSNNYGQELMEYIKANPYYVNFSVTKYLDDKYGSNNMGRIHQQIGTFEEIGNPYISTILKDVSLLRSAIINESKMATVSMMLNDYADSIEEAETRFVNNHLEPVEPKDSKKGLLSVMLDGNIQHYYVPKNVADTFKYDPFQASQIAKLSARLTQPVKDLFVTLNPGWMLRNVPRDFVDTVQKNQEIKLHHIPKLVKYLGQGVKEARQLIVNKEKSPDVEFMLKHHMLAPTRMYSDVERTTTDDVEWLLNEFEIKDEIDSIAEVNKAKSKLKRFVGAVNIFNSDNKFHQIMNRAGQVSELANKIAGYKFLSENTDLSIEEIGHRVRTRVGTPDYKRQGKAQTLTNSLFLYSNIEKEDIRSQAEAFTEDKFWYLWKSFMLNVMPKLALVGALAYARRENIKWLVDCIESMTYFDKGHYTCIPIGIDKNNKAIYMKLPQGHFGSNIGALFYAGMEGKLTGDGGVTDIVKNMAPYGFDNLNPTLTAINDTINYSSSEEIPYDYFRGRMAFPEYIKQGEGGWKAFGTYEWGKLGLDLFYDPYQNMFADTTYDKLTSVAPFNIIKAYLRVTDYGKEEMKEKSKPKTERKGIR